MFQRVPGIVEQRGVRAAGTLAKPPDRFLKFLAIGISDGLHIKTELRQFFSDGAGII